MAIAVASSTKKAWESTANLVITKPSGVAVGDLLVMIVFAKSNSPASLTSTGFTSRATATSGGESMKLLTRVADAGDVSATDYTIAIADSELSCAVMLRVTGWSANDDLSRATGQYQSAGSGLFDTLDLTPVIPDSLIIFAVGEGTHSDTDDRINTYAIVTSNPSWVEAQEVVGSAGAATGSLGVATAIRPEITPTGNFSVADTGDIMYALAICIAPLVNNTETPDPLVGVLSVQAPAVTGGSLSEPAVVSGAFSIPAPTVEGAAPRVVNQDKNSVSFINQPKS